MEKRVFKSKGKLAGGGQKLYRAWKDYREGDYIVGKYEGAQSNKTYPDKTDTLINVIEAQFAFDSKLAKEITGKTFVLNSTGMLDKAREDMIKGEIYQIFYRGKKEIAKGPYKGKESHIIEIDHVTEESDGEFQEDEHVIGEDEFGDDDL